MNQFERELGADGFSGSIVGEHFDGEWFIHGNERFVRLRLDIKFERIDNESMHGCRTGNTHQRSGKCQGGTRRDTGGVVVKCRFTIGIAYDVCIFPGRQGDTDAAVANRSAPAVGRGNVPFENITHFHMFPVKGELNFCTVRRGSQDGDAVCEARF